MKKVTQKGIMAFSAAAVLFAGTVSPTFAANQSVTTNLSKNQHAQNMALALKATCTPFSVSTNPHTGDYTFNTREHIITVEDKTGSVRLAAKEAAQGKSSNYATGIINTKHAKGLTEITSIAMLMKRYNAYEAGKPLNKTKVTVEPKRTIGAGRISMRSTHNYTKG